MSFGFDCQEKEKVYFGIWMSGISDDIMIMVLLAKVGSMVGRERGYIGTGVEGNNLGLGESRDHNSSRT